jgi:peroxiredoxin
LRDRYDELRRLGAELAAVGTGDRRYARWLVEEYDLPYPVLVDDEAHAARAASVPRVGFLRLFHPASWAATRRAWRAGHRVGAGARVNQLGATFVLGPGETRVRYLHYDRHPADHAPLEQVLAALAEGA